MSARERWESSPNPDTPLKGPMHKISLAANHSGLQQRKHGSEQTKVFWEEPGLCVHVERADRTVTRVLVLSAYPTLFTDTVFPGSSTSLHMASGWENAIASPS